MTTPGGSAPDGAWVLGSAYGQDVTEQSFNAAMRAQNTQRGYETAHHALMAQLGQLLMDVAQGLVQGAINLGGTVIGVVTDIVDGIVNLVRNLAGAILGGGQRAAAAGLPDSFAPGELADIADGQNELLERFDLLEDNAGYGNATMSKSHQRSGSSLRWFLDFDSWISAPKNIVMGKAWKWDEFPQNRISAPGFLFQASGVWQIELHTTMMNSGASSYRWVDVNIYEVVEETNPNGGEEWKIVGDTPFSQRSYAFQPPANSGFTISYKTPFVADLTGGKMFHVSFSPDLNPDATYIGGVRWSGVTFDRLSTDPTDYGAPEEADGTVIV